jgi:hypothetical protein
LLFRGSHHHQNLEKDKSDFCFQQNFVALNAIAIISLYCDYRELNFLGRWHDFRYKIRKRVLDNHNRWESTPTFDKGGTVNMADIKSIKKRLQMELKRFRSKENTHYYSRKDYKAAEKQFLVECVLKERCQEDTSHQGSETDHRSRPDLNGGQQDGNTGK